PWGSRGGGGCEASCEYVGARRHPGRADGREGPRRRSGLGAEVQIICLRWRRGPATHPRRPYTERRRPVVEMRDTLAPVHRARPTTNPCWVIWMQFFAHSDALPLVCLQAIPSGRTAKLKRCG